MKKLIGILVLSTALSVPAFAAETSDVAPPMNNVELAQQFIQCTAVMQINAENAKDDIKLSTDVEAAGERYRRAANYYLRGSMDMDDINTYVEGGVASARSTIAAEFKADGGKAVEKRLDDCNTPEMLSKGFDAYQALGAASTGIAPANAAATTATVSSAPTPAPVVATPISATEPAVAVATQAPTKTTVTTTTTVTTKSPVTPVMTPPSAQSTHIPIVVKNGPNGKD